MVVGSERSPHRVLYVVFLSEKAQQDEHLREE